ncbi:MAG: dehydrogenase [Verrucomicrobia bacterium]|nr:MAG: dehydrogenase [Verrucomicrobiota bacterium]
MKLCNRGAIVTGASQGLGRMIAQRFVEEGANVLFCGRDDQMLASVETELQSAAFAGQKVIARRCDVSSNNEVEAMFRQYDSELGQLSILVNNAGIYGPKGPTEEVDWDEWQRCIEINLCGTVIPCRYAITRFKKLGEGKIINLSGGGATSPLPNLSAYAASKAAVVRLTETLAEELRDWHVDVNAIAPGALNTRLLDEILQAGPERVGAEFHARAVKQSQTGGVPLALGADLCVYLASEQSNGISGKLISAKWDPWSSLHKYKNELGATDIYALRRITPEDRCRNWH